MEGQGAWGLGGWVAGWGGGVGGGGGDRQLAAAAAAVLEMFCGLLT